MPAHDPYNAFTEPVRAADGRLRIAVKDMIAVAGSPQLGGIPAREGIRARTDAPVVRAFRKAGHAIVGVTRTDAGGFGTMTDEVENPRDPALAAGGSSGGSAAAVAGRLADVGIGTDTGGSVRIPAAYCGLYAFKPSAFRVDMAGVLPLSGTLDHVGIMTRDAATLLAASKILIPDWTAPKASGARTIRFADEAVQAAEPAVAAPFRALADALGAEPLASPIDYQSMAAASSTVICAEALAVHATLWRQDPEGFPPIAAGGLQYGETVSPAALRDARRTVEEAGAAWRAAVEGIDVLISPTLPMPPAPRHARSARIRGTDLPITDANIRLCQFANAAGLPVVVVPVGGQSVQFVGPFGADEALLAHALALAARLGAAFAPR